MLHVRVSDLKPSMVLARPIPMPHRPNSYLLQRNFKLRAADIRRLEELKVDSAWIRCEELAFLEEVIDGELQERQRELYTSIRGNFERVMRFADAQLDFASFTNSVKSLFSYLSENSTGLFFLDKVQLFDDYLMCHSANVCYVSLLLGMKLHWYLAEERRSLQSAEAKDVVTLGLGCLLHDVGKMKIAKEILDKPGRLTEEEMRQIKMHPVYGYEMVKGKVPAAAANVVLHHHQRWDGSGYPAPEKGDDRPKLAGKKIHVFSRIATVGDVFDAITSKRVYSDAKPSVQALAEILKYNRGYFDPVVERAFFEIMPAFPLGSVVRLNNGFEAAVVDFSPEHPCRPKVKPIRYPNGEECHYPDNREVDLVDVPELHIQFVGEIDIRPYLFDNPFARKTHALASARY
ncbi:MAG: HD-GYP domain-containing protein [Planctomycetota bacterium]